MLKVICLFALVLVVSGQATRRCRPVCDPKKPSPGICAADNHQKVCFRMTQCQLDEYNCRLRSTGKPTVSNVADIRCRNIRVAKGRGQCAKVTRPRRSTKRDCRRLKCRNSSKSLKCYRSKDNLCQRLTPCQLQRINCRRGRRNRLRLTNRRRCSGMKSGRKLRKCKHLKKDG